MVPTTVAVALYFPGLRRTVEILSMMPLVVPPIALVAGVSTVLSWQQDLSTTPCTGPSRPCRTRASR